MSLRKTKQAPPPPPTRYEIETFRQIGSWEMDRLTSSEPTCWNESVSIRKWRIVAEVIEEPKEVLAERLLKLWRECDNWHHSFPMKCVASELGIELPASEFGINAKKR